MSLTKICEFIVGEVQFLKTGEGGERGGGGEAVSREVEDRERFAEDHRAMGMQTWGATSMEVCQRCVDALIHMLWILHIPLLERSRYRIDSRSNSPQNFFNPSSVTE